MFDRVGQLIYPADAADADTMFEAAFDAMSSSQGADNVGLSRIQMRI